MKDGSTSLRYFYDDAGFLREKLFTKRGIELTYPCPHCMHYCFDSVSISGHVDSHHRKGGRYQYLENLLTPRISLREDPHTAKNPLTDGKSQPKTHSPLVADFI